MRKNSTSLPPTSSDPPVKVIGGAASNNFGRATNMKMTSFCDSDKPMTDRMSATLPHFPTQTTGYYNPQHCLTMPSSNSHAPPSPAPADRYSILTKSRYRSRILMNHFRSLYMVSVCVQTKMIHYDYHCYHNRCQDFAKNL